MAGAVHRLRVRFLYKTILKLHRSLPSELKILGDGYVKEEFKRHKDAEPAFVAFFMKEWTDYALHLTDQVSKSTTVDKDSFGRPLSEPLFDQFSKEQLAQLLALAQEIYDPSLSDSSDDPQSKPDP